MACAICHTRKQRRYCPGVRGEICSICCGTEREVTVDCPSDCPYLQEARKHEPSGLTNPESVPNKDIRVTEEYLGDHEALVMGLSLILMRAAAATPGIVDRDMRDALDALIQTYRTLQSGVLYEVRPVNAVAQGICRFVQDGVENYRREETERLGMTHTRDSDVLAVLVFLQRLEIDRNNGRPRSRAFLDFLRAFGEDILGRDQPVSGSSLILP